MKILDDWKVYGGVSDLKQQAEGIPVSQVIINSNYSDDHDDYDIALMKLSRPLTLSGDASWFATQQGWAGLGLVFGGAESGWGWAGARGSSGPLRAIPWAAASWSISPCLGHTAVPRLSHGQEVVHPVRQGLAHPAMGSAVRPPSCRLRCPMGQCGGGLARTLPGWVQRGAFSAPTLLPSGRAGDYSGYFAPG